MQISVHIWWDSGLKGRRDKHTQRSQDPPPPTPRQPAKGSPGESTQFGQTRKRNAPQRVLTKFILGPISAHFQGPSDGPGADLYIKTHVFITKQFRFGIAEISFWDCWNFVLEFRWGGPKFRYGCFWGPLRISFWTHPNFVLTPHQISFWPFPNFVRPPQHFVRVACGRLTGVYPQHLAARLS